jgi:hypothetical protein
MEVNGMEIYTVFEGLEGFKVDFKADWWQEWSFSIVDYDVDDIDEWHFEVEKAEI